MLKKRYILGIDTSNYKTSIAVTDETGIVCDFRRFLLVKQNERGLRQSEALFQHIKNLPELFAELDSSYTDSIAAVAYSERPRPVTGSYMPCFLAGKSLGVSMASILGVPSMGYSHQEGHIEAVLHNSEIPKDAEFIACHFSGGTCEVLKVKQKKVTSSSAFDIEIIGGSKDISFGQLYDRAGVAMGIDFPCGQEMDRIAFGEKTASSVLSPVKVRNGWLNLSGTETQIMKNMKEVPREMLIREIFEKTADSMALLLRQTAEKADIGDILLSGGVSSSSFIRERLKDKMHGLRLHFGSPELSSDNAVGTAFLGGRFLWD